MKIYSEMRVRYMVLVRIVCVVAVMIAGGYYLKGDMEMARINLALGVFFLLGVFVGRLEGDSKAKDERLLRGEVLDTDEYEPSQITEAAVPKTGQTIGDPIIGWDGFDPAQPEYPEELDVALQAWRAVSNNPGNRPKEQLEIWVRTNYPHIAKSNESLKRIATVANWSKGGRPTKENGG